MQSTENRHGPAAMTDACAKDAMRSPIESARYSRCNAKPMPAMSLGLCCCLDAYVAIALIDCRIGFIDQALVIVVFDTLPHHRAELLPSLRVAEQCCDPLRRLLRRCDVGKNAALAKSWLLIATAEQNFAAGAHIGGNRRDARSAGF